MEDGGRGKGTGGGPTQLVVHIAIDEIEGKQKLETETSICTTYNVIDKKEGKRNRKQKQSQFGNDAF